MSRYRALLVVLAASWVTSCRPDATPTKPTTVPSTAVWVGGADGGAWIDCTVDLERNVNPCTIYDDAKGEVWLRGAFVLRGKGRAASREELVYEAFDGKSILLASNDALTITNSQSEGR